MKKKFQITRQSLLMIFAFIAIAISIILYFFKEKKPSVEASSIAINNYIATNQKDFLTFCDSRENAFIFERPFSTELLISKISEKQYHFFLYDTKYDTTLKFWSSRNILPSENVLNSRSNAGGIKLSNGYYYWIKTKKENMLAVALLPIKAAYFVENQYLDNSYTPALELSKSIDLIENDNENANVKDSNGNPVFSVTESAKQEYHVPSFWVMLLGHLGLLMIGIWLYFFYFEYDFLYGFLGLTTALVLLRLITYLIPSVFNNSAYAATDSGIYSYNFVFSNLMHLGVNSVFGSMLLEWIHRKLPRGALGEAWPNWLKKVVLIAVYPVVVVVENCFANLCRGLVVNSQINLDSANIALADGSSLFALLIFCILCFCAFMTIRIGCKFLIRNFKFNRYYHVGILLVIGFVYISIVLVYKVVYFELYALAWLVLAALLYTWITSSRSARYAKGTLFIAWSLFGSLGLALLVSAQASLKEYSLRQKYAEVLINKTDPTTKALMNTMLLDFRNEFLSKQFNRFSDANQNQNLKDSLLSRSFSGLLNNYDINICTFDSQEQPLHNQKAIDLNSIKSILSTEAKPTSVPDLYYHDIAFDVYQYIGKKEIIDTANKTLGFVYFIFTAKSQKKQTIYPELFSKGKDNQIDQSSQYAYAVYNRGRLIAQHNDYVYPTSIPATASNAVFNRVDKGDFDELWYTPNSDRTILIVKKQNKLLERITLFSYFFLLMLSIAGVLSLIRLLAKLKVKVFNWSNFRISIRSQIQAVIIAFSALSFLVIAVFTILFFIKRYESSNKEKLSRAIKIMGNEAKISISNIAIFDDEVKIYDSGYVEALRNTVEKISSIHDADINLFDPSGNLKVSSLSFPYDKGIVSNKMHPMAFYHLATLKNAQFFETEQIGKLEYNSYYIPVFDDNGKAYAYLNIPYFTAQSELKKEISTFIITIINLNAFIFVLAGIVAFFLTNRITKSFAVVSDKMQDLRFGQQNEKIEWDSNDEVGVLVNEYNKMVDKLEESAQKLAKTEREGAWREMARQVAHEIKNPLTPMKLSLQYLQRALQQNSPDIGRLTTNVASTLVEQINHLTNIANEFSQFANIGNPKLEEVELKDILENVTQLNRHGGNVTIQFEPDSNISSKIFADKTQMNRLFTNLVINAIQSKEEGEQVLVEINQWVADGYITTAIKDNGLGIPEEIQENIFTPNFTTKNSGTGLGLAMCKGIVEQANGDIWFETEIGSGTIFFVKLPLVEKSLR